MAADDDFPGLHDVSMESPVVSEAILGRWDYEATERAKSMTPAQIQALASTGRSGYEGLLVSLGLSADQVKEAMGAYDTQGTQNPAINADGVRPQTGEASILRLDQRGANPGNGNQNRSPQTTQTGPNVRKIEAPSADALTALLQGVQTEIIASGRTIISTTRRRETRYVAYITHE